MANALMRDLLEVRPVLKNVEEISGHILEKYEEPKRTYHTIQRAAKVRQIYLTYVDEVLVDPEPNQILVGKLSIWLHDIIRNPSWTDCEERSAEVAHKMFGQAYNINYIALRNNIIAFRTRQSMAHTITSCALDADLTVLSYDEDIYFKVYLPALRRDYARFSDRFWDKKRHEYVTSLLDEEQIFFNMPSLEEAARKNLQKELRFINKRLVS